MNNIITLSGDPGSGKSTVRDALKIMFENQGKQVKIYSVGDIFRSLADEREMTVTELNQVLEEKDTNIDEQLDEAVAKYGEKISRENDENKVYIIDSRMAWKNIPDSYKVRLTVTDQIAGERIYKDKTRGKVDRYKSLSEAVMETNARKRSEKDRYLDLYGVDITSENNFDININTAFVSPNEIASLIVKNMQLEKNHKDINIVWASPKIFIPSQAFFDTIYTYSNIKESIGQKGYDTSKKIFASKRGGMYFLLDGHHRNYAAVANGINILPYHINREKDDGKVYTIEEQKDILRNILGQRYYSVLYSYEEVWRDKNTGKLLFTYDMAYPGIYGIQQNTDTQKQEEER